MTRTKLSSYPQHTLGITNNYGGNESGAWGKIVDKNPLSTGYFGSCAAISTTYPHMNLANSVPKTQVSTVSTRATTATEYLNIRASAQSRMSVQVWKTCRLAINQEDRVEVRN